MQKQEASTSNDTDHMNLRHLNAHFAGTALLLILLLSGLGVWAQSPPSVVTDNASTNEDTPVEIFVLDNDSDPDGDLDTASVNVIAVPFFGTTSVNTSTGSITYTPNLNTNGTDILKYEVCDLMGDCDSAFVNLDIFAVNDLPDVGDDAAATAVGVSVNVDILANDVDTVDGIDGGIDTTTLSIAIAPTNGSAVVVGAEITYTPTGGFSGTDTFYYRICDKGDPLPSACDTGRVVVTVSSVSPVALPDMASVNEDSIVTLTVLDNDTDPQNNIDTSTLFVITSPNSGTLVVSPITGVITYEPMDDFNGVDSFEYRICDLDGNCDSTWVDLTVIPFNDDPVATNDSVTLAEDASLSIPILANDNDDSDPLGGLDTALLSIIVGPANGAASIVAGEIVYTPDPDFFGSDLVTYEICDKGNPLPARCAQANIVITVSPVNDLPIAIDDTSDIVEDNDAITNILINDTDPEGGPLLGTAVTIISGPANGSTVINTLTGQVTYTPTAHFNGSDTYTYVVCDTAGGCDTAEVVINISPENDAPTAVNDTVTVAEDMAEAIAVLANDADALDPLGGLDAASVSVTVAPTNGMVSIAAGVITYTPDLDYVGSDIFTYEVCDTGNPLPALCTTADVVITVTEENDPPIVVGESDITDEDFAVTINVTSNDTDPEDGTVDPNSVSITVAPLNGTATVTAGTGQIVYDPDPDFNGVDQLIYEACDLDGACDTAVVDLVIDPVNDPPTVLNNTKSTTEDTPTTINVLANDDDDIDPAGGIDTSSISVITLPMNGSTAVNLTTGIITYTPNMDFTGVDTFRYQVCDLGNPLPAMCNDARVTINVGVVNDPPIVSGETITLNEDNVDSTSVLLNDTDVEDGTLAASTISIVTGPSNGAATISVADAVVIYTPDANFNGSDSYIYEACDSDGACDTAVVSITVNPVNDPPVAIIDLQLGNEEVDMMIDILADDSDPNDPLGNIDPTSVTIISGPFNGSVTVNPTTGELLYSPNVNFNGLDSLVYEVCDDGNPLPSLCAQARVTVSISPANDAPVANGDADTTPEGVAITTDVTANDSDPNDPLGNIDPTSVSIISGPLNGSVVVNPITGAVTYTPNATFVGIDQYTYEVCDDGNPLPALCDQALVEITVSDEAPTANDDTATTNEEILIPINVLSNDTDPQPNIDPTSVSIVSLPSNGGVSVDPVSGVITYVPATDFNGLDLFSYEVCDLDGFCDQASVTLIVNPVNDPPEIVPDMVSTPEDMGVNIAVTGNDSDPKDPLGNIDVSTLTVLTPPANGSITVDPLSGNILYTPNADYDGPDFFVYEVCDDGNPLPAICDNTSVIITVQPVNDGPIVVDDTKTVFEDNSTIIDILANDSDLEDGTVDPTTVSIIVATGNGSLSVSPTTGAVTYTPNADFNGIDQFIYEVCDSDGLCDQGVVVITVSPVNDAPNVVADNVTALEDVPLTINALSNDSDPSDPAGNIDPTSVSIIAAPSNGAVAVDPVSGEMLYTPNADFNGADSYIYRVCDDGNPLPALCANATVNITIDPANDAPVALDDAASTPEGSPVVVDVLVNDTDPLDPAGGIDPTSVVIIATPSNGTVSVDPVTGQTTYTPTAGFTGTDSYVYEVCDLGSPLPALCDQALVTITVSDEAPTAVDDAASLNEDGSTVVDVLANDTDPQFNIDPTTVTVVAGPANGSTSVDPVTGEVTYIPNADYNGTDGFNYQVCDTDGFCDEGTVLLTINPVNDAPVALNDTETTLEETPVSTNVLANDSDPVDPAGNIDPTTVTITSPPLNGSVTVDPVTGAITYFPDVDFFGSDTYAYNVCDDGNPLPELCDDAVVVIDVTNVPDAPIAIDDLVGTAVDTPLPIAVGDNDLDPDNDLDFTSVAILGGPFNGIASVDMLTGIITYTPNPGFGGVDSLLYQICDSTGLCDQAEVMINVAPEGITANPDVISVPSETAILISPLDNDSSGSGALVNSSLEILGGPLHGTATVDTLTGVITYISDAGYCGPDSILYRICDDNLLCATATIIIDVVCGEITVVNDAASTDAGTPVTISVLDNDSGNANPDCLTIVSGPDNGMVSINGDGTITYTPDQDFVGVDCFIYSVCDSAETAFGQGEVCVEVNPESVQVPGAFSPNNDGYNDFLVIPAIASYPNNEILIFNRWENVVYQARSYANDWDGFWEENGEPLPDGTYFYFIKLNADDPDTEIISGSIHLMR